MLQGASEYRNIQRDGGLYSGASAASLFLAVRNSRNKKMRLPDAFGRRCRSDFIAGGYV